MYNKQSAEEAVKVIESGNRVYIHSVAAAPQHLINAMVGRADELREVEIIHLHTEGAAPYADPKLQDSFWVNNLFIGSNIRRHKNPRSSYVPVFLSEVLNLFR